MNPFIHSIRHTIPVSLFACAVLSMILGAVLLFSGAAAAEDVRYGYALRTGGTGDDFGNRTVVDGSGNVYITGYYNGTVDFDPGAGTTNLTSAGGTDIFVQKLDSTGALVWVKSMGGTNGDEGRDLFVDTSGNVYLTGVFRGTADFDPGAGAANLMSAGNVDSFVEKLDATGNYVWARKFGSTQIDQGFGVTADTSGNVIATGGFRGTADFDPGAGTANLTSTNTNTQDVYVVKLNSTGDYQFAVKMGGNAPDYGQDIVTDGSENIYITGYIQGTADMDPSASTANLVSAGVQDSFVAKLSSTGAYIWAQRMGSTGVDTGYGIELDSAGNVYTTGNYVGTVDFDPGAGAANLTSLGVEDAYIQKLDSSGLYVWAKSIGGAASDIGYAIALDSAANVFAAGYFNGTVDFDPGAGAANLTSAGGTDIFLLALDTDGNHVWSKAMGGTSADTGYGVGVDGQDNVYSTGNFQGTADFDPRTGTVNLTSAGTYDVFVSKLATAPIVDSITPVSSGPTNADSVDFTVTFSEEVTGFNDASGLVINHTGTSSTGVNITGGPVAYTVSLTGIAGDGSITLAAGITSNVVDTASHALEATVTSSAVLIDNTAPTASVGAPSASLTNVGPVSFAVTYAGADTVSLDSTDVTLDVTGTVTATIDVIDGTTNTPTITLSAISGDGTLGISINADTASDTAGNSAPSAGPSGTFNVDNTAPTISPGGPSAFYTTGGPITFNVTYSDAATVNLTAGDVSLSTTGTAMGTISVSDGNTAAPTVTVEDITGDGSLGINIAAGTASDSAGNGAASAGPSLLCVVDNTAPSVAIGAPSTSLSSGGPVSFGVTYTGADTVNLTEGDVSLSATGTATATLSVIDGATITPAVILSGIGGDGTLGISIGGGTATDLAGNVAGGSGPGATFTVDNTAPEILIGSPSIALTTSGPVSYLLNFGDAASVNLTEAAVTLNTTGTATGVISVSDGTTNTPSVTLSALSGDGTVGFSVEGGAATDAAGNSAGSAGPSSTFVVDNTGPVISIGAPSSLITSSGPVSFEVNYADASSVNLTNDAVHLIATGTATATLNVGNGATSTPTVTLSAIGGDGTLSFSMDSGTASDALGNMSEAAGPSAVVTAYNTLPGVGIGSPSTSLTRTGPVSFEVVYGGAATVNLTNDDVTLNTTGSAAGTVSVANGTTATPTITVNAISGDGTLSIQIAAGTATDVAGNEAPAAGPSAAVVVDNTAPVVGVNTLTTSDKTPRVTGLVNDPAANVQVTVDGQTHAANNNGNGTWTLADGVLAPLEDDVYDVAAVATDPAGNSGSDTTTGELVVNTIALTEGRIVSNLSPGFIEEGLYLTLTAPAGHSEYQWYRDGVPLAEDAPRLSGVQTNMLSFAPVLESDSGTYTVRFDNGAKALALTHPFELDVLPPGSLPIASPKAFAVLLASLGAAGCFILRRPKRAA
ncbi:MAG: hypothetical protein HYV27_14580 [Candidatus Hydrogenedentes bacterium]|nr:hypothetical protein [Candidatus Hydrogenedentota bacterium]